MLEQTSRGFRTDFLLMFTKGIIENTETYKELVVKAEVKDFVKREKKEEMAKISVPVLGEEMKSEIRKEEIKEFVHEKFKKESEKIFEMEKVGLLPELKMISKPLERQRPKIRKIPPVLRIPEPQLPETVRHLRPAPTSEAIDLGKLNILIRDPLIKIMECNGPEENILVMGMMGRKPTSIKLNREEVEETVGKFATASRIPVHEGLFKAAFGNLVISAVVSEIVGIKFVIRKISSAF